MNLTIAKEKVMPIGIDLGTSAIKAVQFRTMPDSLDMLAAGSVEIPRSVRGNLAQRLDFTGKALVDILKAEAFKGRQVAISLPAEAVTVRHIKLPKLSGEDTAKAVRWELDGKLPFSVDDAVVRHVVAGDIHGDGEPKQEIIVAAASRAMIESYLRMVRKAHLDPTAIGIECCALVECFGRLFRRAEDQTRTIMFVDVGAASTQVVMAHGSHMVFARNLAIGGEQLDRALAAGMGMPLEQASALRRDMQRSEEDQPMATIDEVYRYMTQPIEDLCAELTQCLRYHESVFRGNNVERVIFVGGQAYDKKVCQSVAQRLNLPAQVGDPLLRIGRVEGAGLDIGLDRNTPQPNWAVAVGLALGSEPAAA